MTKRQKIVWSRRRREAAVARYKGTIKKQEPLPQRAQPKLVLKRRRRDLYDTLLGNY